MRATCRAEAVTKIVAVQIVTEPAQAVFPVEVELRLKEVPRGNQFHLASLDQQPLLLEFGTAVYRLPGHRAPVEHDRCEFRIVGRPQDADVIDRQPDQISQAAFRRLHTINSAE